MKARREAAAGAAGGAAPSRGATKAGAAPVAVSSRARASPPVTAREARVVARAARAADAAPAGAKRFNFDVWLERLMQSYAADPTPRLPAHPVLRGMATALGLDFVYADDVAAAANTAAASTSDGCWSMDAPLPLPAAALDAPRDVSADALVASATQLVALLDAGGLSDDQVRGLARDLAALLLPAPAEDDDARAAPPKPPSPPGEYHDMDAALNLLPDDALVGVMVLASRASVVIGKREEERKRGRDADADAEQPAAKRARGATG